MGNPNGGEPKSVEALFDSLWAKVLSRGMAIIGWPLMAFVAYELYSTGIQMIEGQRNLVYEMKSLSKDVADHEGRLNDLERADRRSNRKPRRDDDDNELRPAQP